MRAAKCINLALLAVMLLTAGCIGGGDAVRPPLPEIAWPPPPETARIRFVNAVTRPRDLDIAEGVLRKFVRYFLGESEKRLVAPYGVAVDAAGRLYVVDTYLKTVHVFDSQAGEHYTFVPPKRAFQSPVGIAVDGRRGFIYVTDSQQGVVKIFTRRGRAYVGEIGEGVLERPTGIAVSQAASELLVVDTLSANVVRYALGDHRLKGGFGGTGSGKGRFRYPTNIWVTPEGRILVSDSLNFRVQIFSPSGSYLNSFGSLGNAPGYFSRPKGVAADSDGNIYVVDALFDNIQVFDRNGRLLMAWGGPGHGYGRFWLPSGIFIDSRDRIYVADTYNRRVQVFQYLKGESR